MALRRIVPPFSASVAKRKLSSMSALVSQRGQPSPPPPAAPVLHLTAREMQLRELLLDVASHIDRSRPGEMPLVLRWAGGWVRDKLLGVESHDIDTAIDSMTGYAFSMRMREFCREPAVIERHRIAPADLGHLHKIAANPDKSKHLETATSKIFGLDVDFVNLRKETYAADSRNPQMEFGTAEEDALRRDATVNALFYNLHTGAVEDFVGGLADMKAKTIRTPLQPLQTFMDDPLRVLRLVRFSSRLGFPIEPESRQAMGEQQVMEALVVKISRERVDTEVNKMLRGGDPRRALELVDCVGLYHAIFTDPALSSFPRPDLSRWKVVYDYLAFLQENTMQYRIFDTLVLSEDDRYNAWMLAALTPWAAVHDPRPANTSGKLPPPFQAIVVQDGLKGTTKLRDLVTGAHRHRLEILSTMRTTIDAEEAAVRRDELGMAIRRWEQHGDQWRLQVLYAMLTDAQERLQPSPSRESIEEFSSDWQGFLDRLTRLDLFGVTSMKRLVDGNMLSKALRVKPGKWMGGAMDVCLAWQLSNPTVTDPSAAIEEVRRRRVELGIPIAA